MKIEILNKPVAIRLYNSDGTPIDVPVRRFSLEMEAGQMPLITLTAELWGEHSIDIKSIELDEEGFRLLSEAD